MGKLTEGLGTRAEKIDLFAWCAEQNAKPIFRRMSRWYYVAENDGAEVITALDGGDADNIRKLLDGKLPDFVGWPEPRMAGYRKWLGMLARQGGFVAPAYQQAA